MKFQEACLCSSAIMTAGSVGEHVCIVILQGGAELPISVRMMVVAAMLLEYPQWLKQRS